MKSEVGSRNSELGSRNSELGSRKLEVGTKKSEIRSPYPAFVRMRYTSIQAANMNRLIRLINRLSQDMLFFTSAYMSL